MRTRNETWRDRWDGDFHANHKAERRTPCGIGDRIGRGLRDFRRLAVVRGRLLSAGTAGAFVWLILFATVSAAQYHCRRHFRWNDQMAQYTRRAAVTLKRKAEATAAIVESATGERARAYYQGRAQRLPREAEKREALAACYEVKARWWDFLQ